jgi:hypothetical protein
MLKIVSYQHGINTVTMGGYSGVILDIEEIVGGECKQNRSRVASLTKSDDVIDAKTSSR